MSERGMLGEALQNSRDNRCLREECLVRHYKTAEIKMFGLYGMRACFLPF